jgi:hypothetical protein
MTEPIAFFDPNKGFYWAKPTKITAPVTVDIEPLALYEQRTWVGLTDGEITDLYFDGFSISKLKDFARAIEAKLKDKNESKN